MLSTKLRAAARDFIRELSRHGAVFSRIRLCGHAL